MASRKAKAEAQLAQIRTVHDFVDADGTCHAITSPRSLKAIWLEGFTPAELKPVTREAIAARPGCECAIMLDTKGPEIRSGFFAPEHGGKLHLKRGQDLELVTD